jgi:hypothetical protein
MREILALSVLIVVAVALWRARTALTHNNLCSLAQRICAKRCLNSRKQAFCIWTVHIQRCTASSNLVPVKLAQALALDYAGQLTLYRCKIALFINRCR